MSYCFKDEYKGKCCCTCRYRVNDWSHPTTDGISILKQRGYICANPELGHYSGWSQHGMCEVWTQRPEPKNDDERAWWNDRYGVRSDLVR